MNNFSQTNLLSSPNSLKKSLQNQLQHSEYIEYQVLYTFDTLKKHQKWQDGKIKNFKINNKLILYSTPLQNSISSCSNCSSCSNNEIEIFTDFTKKYLTELYTKQLNSSKILKFDSVWIMIEEIIGVYERDVLSEFNNDTRQSMDNSSNGSSSSSSSPTTTIHNNNNNKITLLQSSQNAEVVLNQPYLVSLQKQRRRIVGLSRPKKKIRIKQSKVEKP